MNLDTLALWPSGTLALWTALTALSAALAAPLPALAQVARSGPTFHIGGSTAPVMLPDVAFDPIHDRYLLVTGNGFIEAQLLNATGNRIAAVPIHVPGVYSQTPRVAFSPHINNGQGGYLVTWHETLGPFTQVWGKILSHDGTALTGLIVISPEGVAAGAGSHWLAGAAIAYSTQSREFLVTYMGGYQTTQDIRFNRVNIAGQVLQPPAAITAGVDLEREPSVAYNPARNEFYIVYGAFSEAGGFGSVSGQRIQAGTGAVVGGPTMFIQTAAAQIPHVEYNSATGNYIVAWFNRTRSAAAVYGITVRGSDGAVVSDIRVVSSYYSAYDALDFAYNAASNDFVLVTHGRGAQEYEDAAIHLRADGVPVDNGIILTNTPDVRALEPPDGNFNPRVVAGGASGRYLAVTSSMFRAVHGQFAASTGGGGCAPNCQRPPDPRMALDVPGAGNVSGQFAVAGWALDRGAPSGSGVDQVHVWAFNTSNGAATFVGAANLGVSRPDIGAWLGAQFSTSGFGMTGSLPPGTYDINAYARSTVTGLFNYAQARRITVVAPVSQPMMVVDFPAQNQTVTQFFTVAGWAVDRVSSSGPGVSGVHVWAWPLSGGAAIFVGGTTTGHQRPDVAAYLGHPRFAPSGYILQASLPPGQYNLVVFAWSDIAGGFNHWLLIPIRVV
jgi:hypothetical protein